MSDYDPFHLYLRKIYPQAIQYFEKNIPVIETGHMRSSFSFTNQSAQDQYLEEFKDWDERFKEIQDGHL